MLNQKQRIVLSVWTAISISLFLISAAIETGYQHPIQSFDRKGNVLGFNDPISWELYAVLLRSSSPLAVKGYLGFYGAIYVVFHLVALAFFGINPQLKFRRSIAVGFFVQPIIFPMGWIGIIALPPLLLEFFTGRLDGEALEDFPPTWIFQSLWLLVSILAGVLIWRSAKRIHVTHSQIFPTCPPQ